MSHLSTALPLDTEVHCVLSASDSYVEALTLTPIAALPGMVELRITTQWLGAKRPEEQRVKVRCCVTRDRLIDLEAGLRRFLSDSYAEQSNVACP